MAKKAVVKKVVNSIELPKTEKTGKVFTELDLDFADKFDAKKIAADAKAKTKKRTEPVYFPNEGTAQGETVEGAYVGNVPMEKEQDGKTRKFEAVVLLTESGDKIVCISDKAVTRLKKVKLGTWVELTYAGDIRTGSGHVMRNIVVSYFE